MCPGTRQRQISNARWALSIRLASASSSSRESNSVLSRLRKYASSGSRERGPVYGTRHSVEVVVLQKLPRTEKLAGAHFVRIDPFLQGRMFGPRVGTALLHGRLYFRG
jgi:hypothetical protein